MSKTFSPYRMILAATFISMMVSPALGQNNIPRTHDSGQDNDCESLTKVVEKTFALPTGILTSISRVEAGRVMNNGEQRAWPWTINHAGKGIFFDTKDEMLEYVRAHLDDSDQNIDIGCMQINHFWHGDQFMNLDEMADPFTNIVYSAIFLTDLKATHEDWDLAIRHYHNANPDQNTPYVEKVYAVWDMLEHPVDAPILTESKPSSDDAQPINLITAITPDLLPTSDTTKEEAAKEHNPLASNEINTALAEYPMIPATDQNAEVAIIQASTASHTPEPSVAVDPLAKLKAKQPHLRGKWEKVIQFRRLLTP